MPIAATGSSAIRCNPDNNRNQALSFTTTTPRANASSTLDSSHGQVNNFGSPAFSVRDEESQSTGHDLGQLTKGASQQSKDTKMPDPASSQCWSRTANSKKELHESKAQRRGFYGSSHSQASDTLHIGRYQVKRHQNDVDNNRSVKRPRGHEHHDDDINDHDDHHDDRDRPAKRPRVTREEKEPFNISNKDKRARACRSQKSMEEWVSTPAAQQRKQRNSAEHLLT